MWRYVGLGALMLVLSPAAEAQRIAAGKSLRVDETKITSPEDMMLLHREKAAAVVIE
jgi:hypothetical protein